MRIDHALLGYREMSIPAEQAADFLNMCRMYGLVYQPIREKCSGNMRVRCQRRTAKRMLTICRAKGIAVQVTRLGGLPHQLFRYRKRYGIFAGIVLAALITWLGCNVVWDVRVQGEGDMYTPLIMEEIKASGLFVGRWIPGLDTDEVEQKLLTESQGIAWVSVNLKGTVAYVQLRPLLSPSKVQASEQPANLVASEDGIIESVRLVSGEIKVKPGDIVRQGQLLISGVRDLSDLQQSLTQARGEVMARTQHTLIVEIPLVQEEKVYFETVKGQKTLFFFGNPIKITKSTGIGGGNCDTIKRLETFRLFGGALLPLSIQTVEYCPYELQRVTLSSEEAQRRAYEALGRELTLATSDAILLSKTVVCELTQEYCRLTCQYWCVQNIAAPLPFSVGGETAVSP